MKNKRIPISDEEIEKELKIKLQFEKHPKGINRDWFIGEQMAKWAICEMSEYINQLEESLQSIAAVAEKENTIIGKSIHSVATKHIEK